jgi:hypothetical protein
LLADNIYFCPLFYC